ncbi:MAG TPA: hypothetical protein VKZ86_15365 [Cyclobacteriaceae bacterium]|nr:hypothetical protein [Cyclobacteriaceae bacterium]
MKQVFYNGQSYEYKVSEENGVRTILLYDKGVLRHRLTESELDKRTLVSFILDNYYHHKNARLASMGATTV